MRRIDGLAEALVNLLPGHGDVDVSVLGRKHTGRNAGRVVVASLLRHLTVHQVAGGLEVQHLDLCLEQRGLHPLPFPRHFTLQQRHQNALRAEDAGAEISDRDADAHRPLPRQPGDRHQAAHALRYLIEAGPQSIRTVLAEAGNAAIDDAWIDLAAGLIVDAEAVLHIGPVVLDDHVGLLDELKENPLAVIGLQIQGHRPLVTMQVLEVEPVARPAEPLAAAGLRRFLDLDHVGTPIGKLPNAGRSRTYAGEVEHLEAGKRQLAGRHGNGSLDRRTCTISAGL